MTFNALPCTCQKTQIQRYKVTCPRSLSKHIQKKKPKNQKQKTLLNSVLSIVISDLYISLFTKTAQHSVAFSVSEKSREVCVDGPLSTLKQAFKSSSHKKCLKKDFSRGPA